MSGDCQPLPPPIKWAQSNTVLYLTILLEDCKAPTIQIDTQKIHFKGTGGVDKKDHEVTLNLFSEIDPDKCEHHVRDRTIDFIITKKEDGPFWPRLLTEKTKYHWLKVDFDKWKDEDESDDEAMDMGGMGGMPGMGGMGGMGGMPGMGGMGGLGGMPGMGGMGMGGLGGMGGMGGLGGMPGMGGMGGYEDLLGKMPPGGFGDDDSDGPDSDDDEQETTTNKPTEEQQPAEPVAATVTEGN